METLNLRWEELGIKEAQLKAHIQKFEQFIQVPRGVACCSLGTALCRCPSSPTPAPPTVSWILLTPHPGWEVSWVLTNAWSFPLCDPLLLPRLSFSAC